MDFGIAAQHHSKDVSPWAANPEARKLSKLTLLAIVFSEAAREECRSDGSRPCGGLRRLRGLSGGFHNPKAYSILGNIICILEDGEMWLPPVIEINVDTLTAVWRGRGAANACAPRREHWHEIDRHVGGVECRLKDE